MAAQHHIIMLVYPGFELLDLSGPTSVFNAANSLGARPLYGISVVSTRGGRVVASCGITVDSQAIQSVSFDGQDTTVLVVGSEGHDLRGAMRDLTMCGFLSDAMGIVTRCGSVCSGAFVLAAAGLLNGKRAATHWAGCQHLRDWFPDVTVDPDSLYVIDGDIWTSAGVTTGIDMALAMVGQDHGAQLKGKVAKHLVVYAHRPGFQSQFSTVLSAQIDGKDRFAKVLGWIDQNLDRTISVHDMADATGMTERSFYRKFQVTMQITPARYLALARMERATQLLVAQRPVKVVFAQVGFASEAAFRSAFKSHFGTTPTQYKAMHSPAV